MKKFIFSAVALMAFSFAGMANEIEEQKTIEDSPECKAAGRAGFEVARDLGASFDVCVAARIKITDACEKAKKKDKDVKAANLSVVAE